MLEWHPPAVLVWKKSLSPQNTWQLFQEHEMEAIVYYERQDISANILNHSSCVQKVVKVMSPTPHTDYVCEIKPPNSRETDQGALYPTLAHG